MKRKYILFIMILLILLVSLVENHSIVYAHQDYVEVPFDNNPNKTTKLYFSNGKVTVLNTLSKPWVSTLLLAVGFVGLVIEALTPGFGLGAGISMIGFGTYFAVSILTGDSSWMSFLLFIGGIVLIIMEAIIPGFGLPGIAGIVLLIGGIIMAANSAGSGVISISLAIILAVIVAGILIKLGFRNSFLDKVVLSSKKEEDDEKTESKDEKYLGKQGKTVSGLRPSGFIEIDGEKLDVLSDEGFIESGSSVEVIRVEGSKIFVRRV